MPVFLTYSLVAPSPASSVAGDSGFAGGASQLVCDAEAFDQQHFLALVDRLLPEDYLRPLKLTKDAGYEIFQAIAAVAERVSTAVREVECGLVAAYAGGARYASVTVQLYRETAAAGAVTVVSGTLLSTSVGGRQFELDENAVFGAFDTQVDVAASAIAPGYEYNVRGQRVTAGGEVLPGEIDTIDILLQSPKYGDPTIKVRQLVDASGGQADWLSGHGANRGLAQAEDEDENAFRLRIRTLSDTVSPDAMRRIAARILDPLGVPWEFIETFDLRYMTSWDAPSPNVGTPTYAALPSNPAYDPNLFYWDDSVAVLTPYRNRWLGPDDYTGAFILVVDRNTTVADYGMAFDDPGVSFSQFVGSTTGKARGTPAFDVPSPGEFIAAAAFDGTDIAREAAISSVHLALQQAKVAGAIAIVDFYHPW